MQSCPVTIQTEVLQAHREVLASRSHLSLTSCAHHVTETEMGDETGVAIAEAIEAGCSVVTMALWHQCYAKTGDGNDDA